MGAGSYPLALVVKNPPAKAGDTREEGFEPGVGKIARRRKWQPTPVSLPGEFYGQRSLAGYRPGSRKETDKTEQRSAPTRVTREGGGRGQPV